MGSGPPPARVEIRGLKELSAAFKSVDAAIPKEIAKEMKAVADHVVGVAQQRMPHVTGTAQKALRPRGSGRGKASIAFPAGGPGTGGEKNAFYPWLDFGGGQPGARGVTSTSPVNHERSMTGTFRRPLVEGGRYLYPAIGDSRDVIEEHGYDAIIDVARRNGFEVT